MRNMPSLLFLAGTLEFGGSEKKVVKIANALADEGHDVGFAYLNKPDPLRPIIDSRISVTYLDRHGKFSITSLRKLTRLIKVRYTKIVTVNFYPLLYAVPAAKFLVGGNSEVISLINTTEFVDKEWIFGRFYAPFIKRCDKIIFGCEAQKSLWISRYRIPADRSYSIYNGVDSEYFSEASVPISVLYLRETLGIPQEAIVIGSIGRLAPEKHFELLIDAVANLVDAGKNVYLLLVGSGEQKSQLEHAALRRGIEKRVCFAGVMDDVRPAIAAMDVFVLPSRAVETFSNAALEAMAMQRPVVLSRIGGAAEMINDTENGLLFEIGDIGKLTELLTQLHDSEEYRATLGQAARRTILERFGFTKMIDAYKQVIFS